MTYFKMFKKNNILSWLIFIFITSVIYFLFIKQLIYPTIIPMVRGDQVNLFVDWTVILQANICQDKGFDVFVENPCDYWGRKHVYGEILLYFPGIRSVPKFYFVIIPILINLLFIFSIVKLFTYNNDIKYFSIFIFIINPPVILAIERANIDIIIFLITILIAKNKNLFLSHMLVIFASIVKIYPICLSIIFFFEKNIKKIIMNLGIVLLTIIVIMFFQWDSFTKLLNNQISSLSTGYGTYEFSFFGGLNFFNNLNISISNKNYNWIKYTYVTLVVLMPVIYIQYYFFKKFYAKFCLINIFYENNFESKLYILSSTIILLCYFLASNFIYREIFFLGLIPLLLKGEKYSNNKSFFSFYYYILSFKFILTTLLIYISRNKILPNLEGLFVILKHSIDFYIVSIVTLTYILYVKNFIKNKYEEISSKG